MRRRDFLKSVGLVGLTATTGLSFEPKMASHPVLDVFVDEFLKIRSLPPPAKSKGIWLGSWYIYVPGSDIRGYAEPIAQVKAEHYSGRPCYIPTREEILAAELVDDPTSIVGIYQKTQNNLCANLVIYEDERALDPTWLGHCVSIFEGE